MVLFCFCFISADALGELPPLRAPYIDLFQEYKNRNPAVNNNTTFLYMRKPPGLGSVRLSADETLCWHLLEMNLIKKVVFFFKSPPQQKKRARETSRMYLIYHVNEIGGGIYNQAKRNNQSISLLSFLIPTSQWDSFDFLSLQ